MITYAAVYLLIVVLLAIACGSLDQVRWTRDIIVRYTGDAVITTIVGAFLAFLFWNYNRLAHLASNFLK